jgi:hypothetical protein
MKNRKREICTSGSVRDEDGNILIYSARNDETLGRLREPASTLFGEGASKESAPLWVESRHRRDSYRVLCH